MSVVRNLVLFTGLATALGLFVGGLFPTSSGPTGFAQSSAAITNGSKICNQKYVEGSAQDTAAWLTVINPYRQQAGVNAVGNSAFGPEGQVAGHIAADLASNFSVVNSNGQTVNDLLKAAYDAQPKVGKTFEGGSVIIIRGCFPPNNSVADILQVLKANPQANAILLDPNWNEFGAVLQQPNWALVFAKAQ